jgi:hypothetical protein
MDIRIEISVLKLVCAKNWSMKISTQGSNGPFKQWIIDPTVSHNAMCIPEVVCIKNCITYKALLRSILGSISAKYEDEKSITYVNLDELVSWMY